MSEHTHTERERDRQCSELAKNDETLSAFHISFMWFHFWALFRRDDIDFYYFAVLKGNEKSRRNQEDVVTLFHFKFFAWFLLVSQYLLYYPILWRFDYWKSFFYRFHKNQKAYYVCCPMQIMFWQAFRVRNLKKGKAHVNAWKTYFHKKVGWPILLRFFFC